jgi:hypothetical protein
LASCRLIQAKGHDLGGIRSWSQIVRPTRITAAGQRQGGYIAAEDADRGERDHGQRPLGLTELDHPQAPERLANQIERRAPTVMTSTSPALSPTGP